MNGELRETRLIEGFATLADTLVEGYDVVDLLQTLVEICQDVLAVEAVGLLLADESGELDVVASTSEDPRLVHTMQLGAEAGPCHRSFETGEQVSLGRLDDTPDEWGPFRKAAEQLGFGAVAAVPMRLRETRIGVLSLYRLEQTPLSSADLRAAQALADVATIGILHERVFRETDAVRTQLQRALNTRVVIEQAKGVLAHTHGVSTEQAFDLLRGYARSNRLGLHDVAQRLVGRTLIF
ncbi:GAF and ANTAR domain-containing protein [Herbiconiux flava]|uniref:GAF domain-containing protein n=1 Tax=Herbiconiux flava TaxID=881268 RepID=A0A852SSA2_9MICO|nr:GAF and ANTAR domain-containing protein [Herbiconiux flava]NYD71737.1 GAF domain-containing protein [Herbiconiux flava]GLK18299.1 transcriptional regulator [Herbiconiux flava]